jgi:hypothetical protein
MRDDNYDVLADGVVVGRIFKVHAAPDALGLCCQTCRVKGYSASNFRNALGGNFGPLH